MLVRRVLVTNGRRYDKGAFFDKVPAIVGNCLVSSNGEFHLRLRRLMRPAFHTDGCATIMSDYLIARTGSRRPGEVLSAHEEMHEVVLTPGLPGLVLRRPWAPPAGSRLAYGCFRNSSNRLEKLSPLWPSATRRSRRARSAAYGSASMPWSLLVRTRFPTAIRFMPTGETPAV